jgi:hypothetical protein
MAVCKHGVERNGAVGVARLNGLVWFGGSDICECCGSRFYYLEHCFGLETQTWQPKNKCGLCGGEYITKIDDLSRD